MLKYTKKVKRYVSNGVSKAVDVLRDAMLDSNHKHKEILELLILKVETINPKDPMVKFYMTELRKLREDLIDTAAKLAPYESPKLETMEIKQTVEHRMVIRSPKKISSIDEWAKLTGATKGEVGSTKVVKELAPIVPSIHDYESIVDKTKH